MRFKTGTPPRVHKDTIDFDQMEIQPGDDKPKFFSYETKEEIPDQLPCWLTYTAPETHSIISDNLHRAPMFSGAIEGMGTKYCPSIEDKIVRFADKSKHQVFFIQLIWRRRHALKCVNREALVDAINFPIQLHYSKELN